MTIFENICVQIIAIFVYKEIISNSFLYNIAYKLFTYKSYKYNHLIESNQMADVKLNY